MVHIEDVGTRMARTATEVRIRMAEYDARMVSVRASLDGFVRGLMALTIKRMKRRKSKGYRKHLRRMKALNRK